MGYDPFVSPEYQSLKILLKRKMIRRQPMIMFLKLDRNMNRRGLSIFFLQCSTSFYNKWHQLMTPSFFFLTFCTHRREKNISDVSAPNNTKFERNNVIHLGAKVLGRFFFSKNSVTYANCWPKLIHISVLTASRSRIRNVNTKATQCEISYLFKCNAAYYQSSYILVCELNW